jgi:hypothetical protein
MNGEIVSKLRSIRAIALTTAVIALLTFAASPARASTTLEVRPGLGPFYANGKNGGPREYVTRNLSTASRDLYLRNCRVGYSCFAIGEGDGQHTFFELYYCDKRDVSNFLGRGAAVNHQTGNAVVDLLTSLSTTHQSIYPNNVPVSVEWDLVWSMELCE